MGKVLRKEGEIGRRKRREKEEGEGEGEGEGRKVDKK